MKLREAWEPKPQKMGSAMVTVVQTYRGQTQNTYRVTLLSGTWPTKNVVLKALDGDPYFGGDVPKNVKVGDTVVVTVHID